MYRGYGSQREPAAALEPNVPAAAWRSTFSAAEICQPDDGHQRCKKAEVAPGSISVHSLQRLGIGPVALLLEWQALSSRTHLLGSFEPTLFNGSL